MGMTVRGYRVFMLMTVLMVYYLNSGQVSRLWRSILRGVRMDDKRWDLAVDQFWPGHIQPPRYLSCVVCVYELGRFHIWADGLWVGSSCMCMFFLWTEFDPEKAQVLIRHVHPKNIVCVVGG